MTATIVTLLKLALLGGVVTIEPHRGGVVLTIEWYGAISKYRITEAEIASESAAELSVELATYRLLRVLEDQDDH